MTIEQKQALFNYFAEYHGVLLLESDFDEIINILKDDQDTQTPDKGS